MQEVAFSLVTVYVSSFELAFTTLVLGSSWVLRKGFHRTVQEFDNLYMVQKIFRVRSFITRNFLLDYYIYHYSGMNATDPRDKVYALLGLSSGSSHVELPKPDYSLDVVQVYGNTLRSIFQNVSYCDDGVTRAFSLAATASEAWEGSFPS